MSAPRAARAARAVPAGAVALFALTLGLTLARSIRWPNDFAEAHWLLDYRFGFVKRGLGGQLLAWGLAPFGAEPSPEAIAAIAAVVLAGSCAAMLWVASRLARASGWSPAAILVGVALVSSPYVVMSGHLTGYFDGVLVLLAFAAIVLLAGGRLWAGCAVQSAAVLMHESAILVGFPVLCLAWWRACWPGRSGRRRAVAALPLLLPLVTFAALGAAGQFTPEIEDAFSARLAAAGFIEGDMHLFVPEWLRPGFAEQIEAHSHRFGERVASAEMYGLMLPTILAMLTYLVEAYRVPARSATMAALPLVVLAPELLHLAAWDTVRIWTYPIAMTMLVAVVLLRTGGPAAPVSAGVRLLAIAAVVVNVMAMTPLLDNLADRYTLGTRLLLYAPVLAACAWLFARPEKRSLA